VPPKREAELSVPPASWTRQHHWSPQEEVENTMIRFQKYGKKPFDLRKESQRRPYPTQGWKNPSVPLLPAVAATEAQRPWWKVLLTKSPRTGLIDGSDEVRMPGSFEDDGLTA